MNPLQAIEPPADLRKLPRDQLGLLARRLRQRLAASGIPAVSGLDSGLDSVELAIALHYVFDTQRDRIAWDAPPNPARNAGFPWHTQSAGDGGAHASSVSVALGIAQAARLQGADKHAVAVVGNDAIGAGVAFEALNNAGVAPDTRLLVILDDHDSGNGNGKATAAPVARFGALGLNHTGPVDGHDLEALVSTLEHLRQRRGPQLLHVITRTPAGELPAAPVPGCAELLGDWLCDMAGADPRLVGIAPGRCAGPGMARFAAAFPARCFEVGSAEQHAVTFAGGLATEGMKPVVAVHPTLLQRGYDQLIHDVALQRLDVTFAVDGAGQRDIACLRCVPNLVLMAASDDDECRQMLVTAYRHPGPAAVRSPRHCGAGAAARSGLDGVEFGRAEPRRAGRRTAILAFGAVLAPSLAAAGALDATVVNMRFIKPLDTERVLQLARAHEHLVTVEDGFVTGGAGAAVAEALAEAGIAAPLLMLGQYDAIPGDGGPATALDADALDADAIVRAIRRRFPAGQERQVANDG